VFVKRSSQSKGGVSIWIKLFERYPQAVSVIDDEGNVLKPIYKDGKLYVNHYGKTYEVTGKDGYHYRFMLNF
jgi:hypothetical protein